MRRAAELPNSYANPRDIADGGVASGRRSLTQKDPLWKKYIGGGIMRQSNEICEKIRTMLIRMWGSAESIFA